MSCRRMPSGMNKKIIQYPYNIKIIQPPYPATSAEKHQEPISSSRAALQGAVDFVGCDRDTDIIKHLCYDFNIFNFEVPQNEHGTILSHFLFYIFYGASFSENQNQHPVFQKPQIAPISLSAWTWDTQKNSHEPNSGTHSYQHIKMILKWSQMI